MEPTKYYSLLYIDQVRNRNINLAAGSDPIDIYLACASLCAKTFRLSGESFCLITNDTNEVQRRLERLGLGDLPFVSFEFLLQVPQEIPFYSAHFKLDLFRGFGSGEFGRRVGFVDLDTVLLRGLPKRGDLGVYDISDQVVPIYKQHRITADLNKVSGKSIPEARWYGGEFLSGSASMFRIISTYVEEFWENYIQNVASLVHVGDEMVMSAALNCARLDGVSLVDYGELGSVARWWTSRTQHQQHPFDAIKRSALLHLPADKLFLAKQAKSPFETEAFLRKFRAYARRRCIPRRILYLCEALLREPKQFPPVLTGSFRE